MRVRARLVRFRTGWGYDLAAVDPQATVADYLLALERLAAAEGLTRLRNPGGTCFGCPRCCSERVPLTSIDALRLAAAVSEQGRGERTKGRHAAGTAEVQEEEAPGGPAGYRGREGWGRRRGAGGGRPAGELLGLIRRYGRVTVWGRAVDITLQTRDDGTCVLLDTSKGLCRLYAFRPLVCRTYLCCPATRRAHLVREAVVNAGQDDLVRLILRATGPEGFPVHEAERPDLRPEDWPRNAFSGRRNYAEIPLRKVLPPRLWARLLAPSR